MKHEVNIWQSTVKFSFHLIKAQKSSNFNDDNATCQSTNQQVASTHQTQPWTDISFLTAATIKPSNIRENAAPPGEHQQAQSLFGQMLTPYPPLSRVKEESRLKWKYKSLQWRYLKKTILGNTGMGQAEKMKENDEEKKKSKVHTCQKNLLLPCRGK